MFQKNFKSTISLIIIVVALIVFSGCVKKQRVNDKEQKIIKEENRESNKDLEKESNGEEKSLQEKKNKVATTTSDEIIEPERKNCEDEMDTISWLIYRNDKYGIEFKYPKIGARGKKTVVVEKENLINICEEEGSGFCNYLEVFEKKEEETIQEAIKKFFLEEKDEACYVKDFTKIDEHKQGYIITSEPQKSRLETDCSRYGNTYGLRYFLYDTRYPQTFFFLTIGHDSFLPRGWVKSIKIIL